MIYYCKRNVFYSSGKSTLLAYWFGILPGGLNTPKLRHSNGRYSNLSLRAICSAQHCAISDSFAKADQI